MRLIGYVDGIEVKFDFYPPNNFKATIPKHLDGIYIVQFKVIDDAGNETNYSDIFMYLDFQKMKFRILNEHFKYIQNGEYYGFIQLNSKLSIKEINNKYSTKLTINNYSYRELVI